MKDRRRQEEGERRGKVRGRGSKEAGRVKVRGRRVGHYLHLPLMSMGVLVLLVTILGARSSEMSR